MLIILSGRTKREYIHFIFMFCKRGYETYGNAVVLSSSVELHHKVLILFSGKMLKNVPQVVLFITRINIKLNIKHINYESCIN